jgi:hypothetical protein
MVTIKRKTETTTVAQHQREGFTPLRTLATMFHTIAQTITDAVTTLHDRTFPTLQFIGCLLCSVEVCRETIGDVIEIRVWVCLTGGRFFC